MGRRGALRLPGLTRALWRCRGLGWRAWAVAALLLALAAPAGAQPRDPEPDLVVRAFVQPEGERLHVLARVPLAMLQGFGLPVREQGHLDLAAIDEERLDQAALAADRELRVVANGVRLAPAGVAHRISRPDEQAFDSMEGARSHILGPELPPSAQVFWNQGWFDAWLVYPLEGGAGDLALDVGLDSFGEQAVVMVTFIPAEGVARTLAVHGGHGLLALDPDRLATAAAFLRLGAGHMLGGLAHVLLLLGLLLPLRLRPLAPAIAVTTSLVVAHATALTMAASAPLSSGDWFAPLIGVLLAASVVWVALENLVAAWLGEDAILRRRWLIALAFGLVHGLAMALALDLQLQFAGGHPTLALLAFILGIELALVAVLLAALPLLALLLRRPRARLVAVVMGSALLAHIGWHRLLLRLDELRFVTWPGPGEMWQLLLLAGLLGGLLVLAWAWPRWGRRRAGGELPR
jgi:hypothetical protein